MPSSSSSVAEDLSDVEFLDIGCGDGRSTLSTARRLALEGKVLGIDKVAVRLPGASPLSNVRFSPIDVAHLPNRKSVQFSTLLNVLPGLPSALAAFDMLRKACIVSRNFVYVSQVNFDAGPYLLRKGFKTFYADQAGSRFQGSSLEYLRMAKALVEEGLVADYALIESERIRDSGDPAIHPLQSPPEAGPYDPALHRHKPVDVPFREPVYKRLQIVLCRKPAQLVPIAKRLRLIAAQDNVIFSTIGF